MSDLAEILFHEHRRLEELLAAVQEAARAGDWRRFPAALGRLRDTLKAHFALEEDEVFPEFERQSGLTGALAELRSQHEDIRHTLDTLLAVSPRHDPEGCRAELAGLAAIYRQHEAEEERLIYAGLERAPRAQAEAQRAAAAQAQAAELDVRGLEPPEPMTRILDALARARGKPLRVLIHREPFPLYELLDENGRRHRTVARGDGSFEILIEP